MVNSAVVVMKGGEGKTESPRAATKEIERNAENKSQSTKWHKEIVEMFKDGIDFIHLIPYHEVVKTVVTVRVYE